MIVVFSGSELKMAWLDTTDTVSKFFAMKGEIPILSATISFGILLKTTMEFSGSPLLEMALLD